MANDENLKKTEKTVPPEMPEAEIDSNIADTFPASDPPSWTLGTDHDSESSKDEQQDRTNPRKVA
jgi:hypothetical protein